MTIIDKYLTREILKYLGMVVATVVGIYLAVDFFENVDKFMKAGVKFSLMIQFFYLKLPLIISQISPVALFLAILITFGLMNKSNEILALKSGGVSIYSLLKPVLIIGILMSIFHFILAEIAVPITISEANKIWRLEVKKKTALTYKQNNIWIKGKRSICYISYFNPQKKSISGITFNLFDEDFNLIQRIDANQGFFKHGKWVLDDIMEQVFNAQSGAYDVQFHKQQAVEIDFSPEDLKRVMKKSEEMGIQELLAYIHDVESEGYDATIYRVDFYAKTAYPLTCIILCIIATGIAVKRRFREGISVSVAIGLGVVFLYWIVFSFCLSLGYGEMLPPVVAAWISNFIFLCLGLYNLLNVE